MKSALTLALLAAASAFTHTAFAQTAPPEPPRPDRGARMFEMLDANRDARITWDESWAFVTARFTVADTDRNGALSVEEFAALRMRRAEAPAASPERAGRMERMRGAMFRSLDANRDGQVTLDEARPFIEARFRAADANGDGAVARDEVPQRGHHRGPNH